MILLIVKSDASCGKEAVGIGYVIRHDGRKYTGTTFYEGEYSSLEGEYMAVREAVEVIPYIRDDDRSIYIYTDCDPLIGKIEEPNGSKEWNERRGELMDDLSDYDWHMKWIPRDENEEADALAKEGLNKRCSIQSPSIRGRKSA